MAQNGFDGQALLLDRRRQRHRPGDGAEAGRRRAPSCTSPTATPRAWRRRSPTPGRLARRCPSTARSTSPTTTRWPQFAADIHASHPAMDVVMNIAGVSAWGTVDQLTHEHWKSMIDINLMGPIHVIETFVPPMVAAGTRRAPGQRVVGRGPGGAAVARRLQRKQVRPARTVRGAALRPGPAPHRGVGCGARRGENASGADGSDRGRGPRGSARAASGRTGSRTRGLARSTSPTRSCAGVTSNRFLIYTSPDIRALYLFKRAAWWPYSVAMRQVNVLFTRALRPGRK